MPLRTIESVIHVESTSPADTAALAATLAERAARLVLDTYITEQDWRGVRAAAMEFAKVKSGSC